MPTTKRATPDLSDLWKHFHRPSGDAAGTSVQTLSYVQHANGPVITVVTNEPIHLDQLLRAVSARQSP